MELALSCLFIAMSVIKRKKNRKRRIKRRKDKLIKENNKFENPELLDASKGVGEK